MRRHQASALVGLFIMGALAGCMHDAPSPASPYVTPASSVDCAQLPLAELPRELVIASGGTTLEAALVDNATVLGTDGALTRLPAYDIGSTSQAGPRPLAEPLRARILPLEDTLLSQFRLPDTPGESLTPAWQTLGMDLRDGILIGPEASLGLTILLGAWEAVSGCRFRLALPNGTSLEALSDDADSWRVTPADDAPTFTVTASLETAPRREATPILEDFAVRPLVATALGPNELLWPDFAGTPFADNWSALMAQHTSVLATREEASFAFPWSFYCCAELTDGAYDYVRRTGTERGIWQVVDRAVSGTGADARMSPYLEHAIGGLNAFQPSDALLEGPAPVDWQVPEQFLDLTDLYEAAPTLVDHISFTRVQPTAWGGLHVDLSWASPSHDRYLMISADAGTGRLLFTAAMEPGSFGNAWTQPTFLPPPNTPRQ